MNSVAVSLKRAFRQPAFTVAVLVLAICALSLNTAAGFLKLKFKKQALPLRVASLKEGIPGTLGNWVMVSVDQAIDPEVEQVLGTSQYVFRDYVDSRKISPTDIEQLKSAPAKVREGMLGQLQTAKPSAVMRVGVTYYTGLVDTVAHVPERCYVADGFEVKEYQTRKVPLGNYADGTPRDIEYRFLGFEDQASVGQQGVQRVARNVGYLFHCNGRYESSPYEVRRRLQNLFEPYGYYAKVELMTAATVNPNYRQGAMKANDRDDSMAAMEDFLSEALPEIEKCLPDWKAAHAKK